MLARTGSVRWTTYSPSYYFNDQTVNSRSEARRNIVARDSVMTPDTVGALVAVIAGLILALAVFIYYTRARRHRIMQMHKEYQERTLTQVQGFGQSATTRTAQFDIEQQVAVPGAGFGAQPTNSTGEAYTIEGPKGEVRLAYHQDLPRDLIEKHTWPPVFVPSATPGPSHDIHDSTTGFGQDRADVSHLAEAQPVQSMSNENSLAILALQKEVLGLRAQISRPITGSQDENPFNPPEPRLGSTALQRPDVNRNSTAARLDGGENPFLGQIELLQAEVDRLRAENAALVMADPSSPPAYQLQDRDR